jgi:hypothetical protein
LFPERLAFCHRRLLVRRGFGRELLTELIRAIESIA